MTALDLRCKAATALHVCIDHMTSAGVSEADQAEWIEQELLYLAERAVDFQRVSDQVRARKETPCPI